MCQPVFAVFICWSFDSFDLQIEARVSAEALAASESLRVGLEATVKDLRDKIAHHGSELGTAEAALAAAREKVTYARLASGAE